MSHTSRALAKRGLSTVVDLTFSVLAQGEGGLCAKMWFLGVSHVAWEKKQNLVLLVLILPSLQGHEESCMVTFEHTSTVRKRTDH